MTDWPGNTSARRVVVAEDEALIRLDLIEMLTEAGYTVVGEAGDGQQAIELARQERPDLVILDVKMPVLDGISAAERITAENIAPVVLLTAFSQRSLVERATEAGAMAYLVKPFTPADLFPAIEVALARYAQMLALADEVGRLDDALQTRKLLERAKSALTARYGLSEPDAFGWIQRAAMDRRMTMRQVAEVVLAETPDVPSSPPE
jgi:response regulator NasT